MNAGLFVPRSAARRPDATAAWEGERTLSYRDLDLRSSRLANALVGRYGLQRGDRVALLVHSRLEVVEVLAACAKAGLVYVGLNFRLAEAEYESIFDNAQPRLVISEGEMADLARGLAASGGIPVIDIDDASSDGYEALLASGAPTLPSSVHEAAWGRLLHRLHERHDRAAEGVLFDHAAALSHAPFAALEYGLDADSRWLIAIPHNFSMHITLLPLLMMGGAIGFSESRVRPGAVRLRGAGAQGDAHVHRAVDEERKDVPDGERGEVIFGGPYVMKGYYRDPERTDEVLVDGWMHSG